MNLDEPIRIVGRKSLIPSEVILLKADRNYTQLFLNDGSMLMVATPLKILETRFCASTFFRTHKSFIVNLQFVVDYCHTKVILSNQEETLLARRKKTEFFKLMKKVKNSL